jgi:glycosyltransferase involved in cell wall biosynthesis
MALSVVYVTHREEPRFDWFANGLARQLSSSDEVELIVVDGRASLERASALGSIVASRFPVRQVQPKPNPYNGPSRRTSRDYAAIASARNTGLVHARHPYVLFVDDASVPMPRWWQAAREAAAEGYVVGGAYQKHWEMVVEDGLLVSSRSERSGIDHRWETGSDDGPTPMHGGHLFGCSFGAPRDLLLAVNGADELCDPVGGEDYHLGIRLEWSGASLRYDRRLLTIESEEHHRRGTIPIRVDKLLDDRRYFDSLASFGVAARSVDGTFDVSHLVLDVLYGTRSLRSLGNGFDVATLAPGMLPELAARLPTHYWADRQPFAEL